MPYDATTHYLPHLPGKIRKGCLLAACFVDRVKCRTVKHWICTDKARVNLMRNEPDPNVESNFNDGNVQLFAYLDGVVLGLILNVLTFHVFFRSEDYAKRKGN